MTWMEHAVKMGLIGRLPQHFPVIRLYTIEKMFRAEPKWAVSLSQKWGMKLENDMSYTVTMGTQICFR
jgi:hypothetical protein